MDLSIAREKMQVNSAKEELEEANNAVEAATQKAFVPHMESSTKEEALRSLINSLTKKVCV